MWRWGGTEASSRGDATYLLWTCLQFVGFCFAFWACICSLRTVCLHVHLLLDISASSEHFQDVYRLITRLRLVLLRLALLRLALLRLVLLRLVLLRLVLLRLVLLRGLMLNCMDAIWWKRHFYQEKFWKGAVSFVLWQSKMKLKNVNFCCCKIQDYCFIFLKLFIIFSLSWVWPALVIWFQEWSPVMLL